jgi:pimeloyl-ACP methyl ester carboxylesterase
MFICFIASNAQQFKNKLQLCKPPAASDSVYCGSFAVFENHKTGQGRKINLNIIVIPAIDSSAKKSPVFYFDGGPGVAATKNVDFFSEKSNPYRKDHDIVLVDIRGTGGSNPLHCLSLQYKRNLQDHFEEMYPAEAVKSCFDSLSTLADLSQYTTTNIVMDLEEVRQWLGYKKLIAFGLSYGTRLTQEYIRRFPASIETAVLWSPTSTGSRMPLYHAEFAQASLNKLFIDCKADSSCNQSYPKLKDDFTFLMDKMRKEPMQVKLSDSLTVAIPWHAFHTKIRSQMYLPLSLRQLPFIIHEAANGDWKPFLGLYPKEGRFDNFSAEGLYLSITCAEDVPFIKKKEAKRLAKNTFMGDYRVAQQKQACANWIRGEIPSDFLLPVKSDIPVLILAGEWDPVTPVSMAKEIAKHLPNSQLVVVPQMSHISGGLSNEECLDEMILSFIKRSGKEQVNSDCINKMMLPAYKTGKEQN